MGNTITTIMGAKVEILSKLGEGGQGIVYKVNYNGQPKALKMYKPGVIKYQCKSAKQRISLAVRCIAEKNDGKRPCLWLCDGSPAAGVSRFEPVFKRNGPLCVI